MSAIADQVGETRGPVQAQVFAPVQLVYNYFGSKPAYYFAWLNHYCLVSAVLRVDCLLITSSHLCKFGSIALVCLQVMTCPLQWLCVPAAIGVFINYVEGYAARKTCSQHTQMSP
jgi:hypothetical protein